MFILCKDQRSIINMDQITTLYIGSDSCTIKADFQNGKGCQVGRYNSDVETIIALGMVFERVKKMETCKIPTDEDVRAKTNNFSEQKNHHISGKKTKGHGGS